MGVMERDEPHAGGREDSARRREDLIRETFDRWSKGDYEPWTEAIHPQAEVVSQLVNRVYHGYAGIREWAAEVLDSFDEWDAAIAETVEAPGDRLLVIGRVHMRGRGSGVDLEVPCAWLFDFLEGRMARMEIFINRTEEAHAAAGLRSD